MLGDSLSLVVDDGLVALLIGEAVDSHVDASGWREGHLRVYDDGGGASLALDLLKSLGSGGLVSVDRGVVILVVLNDKLVGLELLGIVHADANAIDRVVSSRLICHETEEFKVVVSETIIRWEVLGASRLSNLVDCTSSVLGGADVDLESLKVR